jgi:hypothetical protein
MLSETMSHASGLKALVAAYVDNDETAFDNILATLSEADREQLVEELEVLSNMVDPDGHDCRAE